MRKCVFARCNHAYDTCHPVIFFVHSLALPSYPRYFCLTCHLDHIQIFPVDPKCPVDPVFATGETVWGHTLHLDVGSLKSFDIVPPFSVTLTHESHQPLFHPSGHSRVVPSSSFLSSLSSRELEVMSEGLMDSI